MSVSAREANSPHFIIIILGGCYITKFRWSGLNARCNQYSRKSPGGLRKLRHYEPRLSRNLLPGPAAFGGGRLILRLRLRYDFSSPIFSASSSSLSCYFRSFLSSSAPCKSKIARGLRLDNSGNLRVGGLRLSSPWSRNYRTRSRIARAPTFSETFVAR